MRQLFTRAFSIQSAISFFHISCHNHIIIIVKLNSVAWLFFFVCGFQKHRFRSNLIEIKFCWSFVLVFVIPFLSCNIISFHVARYTLIQHTAPKRFLFLMKRKPLKTRPRKISKEPNNQIQSRYLFCYAVVLGLVWFWLCFNQRYRCYRGNRIERLYQLNRKLLSVREWRAD